MRPLARCGGIVAYLAALLLVDTQVALEGQLALGALTWAALAWVLLPETALVRAQTLVVVCVATCGEVVGSIIWGVYTYRLENLPGFVPPAHGLVFLAGASLARAAARPAARAWLVRGRAPAVYAGVFVIVAWLELYGTALGTWAWAVTIPGTGIPNGNPPSGVAAGYVWFDIVALAVAPRLLALGRRLRAPSGRVAADGR